MTRNWNTRLLTQWLGILLPCSRPSVKITSNVAGQKAFTAQWFKGSGLEAAYKAVKQAPQKQSRKNRRLWVCCCFLHSMSWNIGRIKWHLVIGWQIPMLPRRWVELGHPDYSVPSLILAKWTHKVEGQVYYLKLSPNYLFISLSEDERKCGMRRKQTHLLVWGCATSWAQVCVVALRMPAEPQESPRSLVGASFLLAEQKAVGVEMKASFNKWDRRLNSF